MKKQNKTQTKRKKQKMNKNHVKKLTFKKIILSPAQLTKSYLEYEENRLGLSGSLNQKASEQNLISGLYYVVLVDLVDSSTVADKISNRIQYAGWLDRFDKITQDSLNFQHRDTSVHIERCGDSCIFLFRNFDDILQWRNNLHTNCSAHNRELGSKRGSYPYYTKTIVHLSDIHFDRNNSEDKSFVLDVVFNIEKQFHKDDLGITEAVREGLMPEINSGRFTAKKIVNYVGADKIEFSLWKLFGKSI